MIQEVTVDQELKSFFFTGKGDLPSILLDKEKNKYIISGNSLPEDVAEFYKPVLEWFDNYAKKPNEKTVIDINLEYVNTGTSRMLFFLLNKLQQIHHGGNEVVLRWHYLVDDEDLREEGKIFKNKFEFPIELIYHFN